MDPGPIHAIGRTTWREFFFNSAAPRTFTAWRTKAIAPEKINQIHTHTEVIAAELWLQAACVGMLANARGRRSTSLHRRSQLPLAAQAESSTVPFYRVLVVGSL